MCHKEQEGVVNRNGFGTRKDFMRWIYQSFRSCDGNISISYDNEYFKLIYLRSLITKVDVSKLGVQCWWQQVRKKSFYLFHYLFKSFSTNKSKSRGRIQYPDIIIYLCFAIPASNRKKKWNSISIRALDSIWFLYFSKIWEWQKKKK